MSSDDESDVPEHIKFQADVRSMEDSLHHLPEERWGELQEELKSDFPRCISGYYILETQRKWKKRGIEYPFQVYCPYGDVSSGMVAFNMGNPRCEIVIMSPKDDTKILEEALQTTKLIDWKQAITMPFTSSNVSQILEKSATALHKELEFTECDRFTLSRDMPMFEVRLPSELTFKHVTLEHAELIDSKWPHRYPGSVAVYETLIKNKAGYGLYSNQELVSWIFISELGYLLHLFTLEEHRRKGYAEIVMKMISNIMREEDPQRIVFAYVVKGNAKSFKLFKDLGFMVTDQVAWYFMV